MTQAASYPRVSAGIRGSMAVASVLMAAACAAAPAPESLGVYGPDTSHAAHTRASASAATPTPAARRAAPDAEFLGHMVAHHAQAIVMARMVAARTQRPELRLMAERIAVSQRDEIAQMAAWLQQHGHAVPAVDTMMDAHAGHAGHAPAGHAGMPGMLTAGELAQLQAAAGTAFERLFLEYMIRHHQGAITMVGDLFRAGGGQDSQVYAIASEVESDQRMEIARMERLLASLPSAGPGGR